MALADAHPFVLEKSHDWEAFRRGRLADARKLADKFAADGIEQGELNLEIALAIESGNWEAVARPLEVFRAHPNRFAARDILDAANVARATGQSDHKELTRLAVERAGEDASVLIGAHCNRGWI